MPSPWAMAPSSSCSGSAARRRRRRGGVRGCRGPSWARSMASNRALKLPAPKPLAPARWMISKKTVGPVAQVLGEDLQQVAVLVPVDHDAQLGQVLPREVDAVQALPGVVVVLGRDRQEADAPLPHGPHRGHDVGRVQRHVLDAGRAVVVEVLLDLALAAPLGRLVDGQDHLVVVPHHRRHEGRVLGRDLVVVEVDQRDRTPGPPRSSPPTGRGGPARRWPRCGRSGSARPPGHRDGAAAGGRSRGRTRRCRPSGRGRCGRSRRRCGWPSGGRRRARRCRPRAGAPAGRRGPGPRR